MSAIVIKDLTKKIRRNIVFQNMDLEVYDGEFFSLMGSRGSGKTTLLNILFYFLKPNKGSVSLLNMDVKKENKEIKKLASFIPDEVWFYPNQKAGVIFKNTMRFYELQNLEEQEYLIDYFGLDTKTKFGYLDDESRKITAIINALISKPQLLVMDEPTNDLSHEMADKLFSYLMKRKREDGMTIFLLTEDLSLGQRYGERAGYLVDGKVQGIEYLNTKESPDKILRIFGQAVNVDAFESIGAHRIHQSTEETAFFYNDYLPTLTTILHQQRIKSYSLEDANLEEKLISFREGYHKVERQDQEELIISSTKQMEPVVGEDGEDKDKESSDTFTTLKEKSDNRLIPNPQMVSQEEEVREFADTNPDATIKIEPVQRSSADEGITFEEDQYPHDIEDLPVHPEEREELGLSKEEFVKDSSEDDKPAYRNTLVFKNDTIDQALREDNESKGKEKE